jgi:SAM-dependent methyltransferase
MDWDSCHEAGLETTVTMAAALDKTAVVLAITLMILTLVFRLARQQLDGLVGSLLEVLNHGSDGSRWLNLGLWPAPSYAVAARELALRVGRAATVDKGSHVLDVGCGFGESLRLWHTLGAMRIVGINSSAAEVASARATLADVAATITVLRADGARLPADILDGRFDAVVSIDAAYHFATREHFFRCAWAALRPGGRLATADVVAASERASLRTRLLRPVFCVLAGIPCVNVSYCAAGYTTRLRTLGFERVAAEDVTERVLEGFGAWGSSHRGSIGVRIAAGFIAAMRKYADVAFVIVTATKLKQT